LLLFLVHSGFGREWHRVRTTIKKLQLE